MGIKKKEQKKIEQQQIDNTEHPESRQQLFKKANQRRIGIVRKQEAPEQEHQDAQHYQQ